jgi:hypothetical protein
MRDLEVLLALSVAVVVLASAVRRVGAPYAVFLALGGALLAFLPGAPSFTLPPDLVLVLFVAPVLLAPERMIRMLIIGYCFGIRSERRLCEEVHLNLA